MRKAILGILLAGFLVGGFFVSGAPAALAHMSGDRQADMQRREERRLERLTEALGLTADQQAKIKALFDAQRAKMKAIHEETRTKMMALLNSDQKAKFEKWHEEKARKD
jgi:Spy/CpxP family protein refolding chaperone